MNVAELGPSIELWISVVTGVFFASLPLVISSIDKLEKEEVIKCGVGILLIVSSLFSVAPVEKELNERLDAAFTRELLDQYGAYSNKSYTAIRKDIKENEESKAVFKQSSGEEVVSIIEREGELMFITHEGVMNPKMSNEPERLEE